LVGGESGLAFLSDHKRIETPTRERVFAIILAWF
jgi:hypothetical protein